MATAASAPPRAHSFKYTATGILGDKRKSMLCNELHLRSELGKSKGHGHQCMTDPTYIYGRANPPRDTGVAGALVWKETEVKFKPGAKGKKARKGKTSYDEAFGQPARPGTPINDVLTFKFQNDWLEEQRKLQKDKMEEARSKRVIPGAYRENHTSTLRSATRQPEVADDSLWQMSKFSRHATHKIDTFRSESARERSIKNME